MKNFPDDFYLEKPEPVKGTLLALRSIIINFDDRISETVKYGMPCFLYAQKIFCYLWTDTKTGWPYILMAEGRSLNHPCLQSGGRAKMKILPVDPYSYIPLDTIAEILDQARNLYKIEL
ncbi:MAG: DUF1801 domain-containing protein [Alistipes sp.]|nr:DUF1801 domain-containing protein [Alistipes sp.]